LWKSGVVKSWFGYGIPAVLFAGDSSNAFKGLDSSNFSLYQIEAGDQVHIGKNLLFAPHY